MRISTHLMGGAAVGAAFAPNVLCLAAAIVGSIVPDWLDSACARLMPGSWKENWQRIHRRASHNAFYWLCAGCAIAWLFHKGSAFAMIALFFLLGVLSHLLLDSLTPSGIGCVPFKSGTRIGFGLVRTNSLGDTATGVLVLALAVFYRLWLDDMAFLREIALP